MMEIYFMWIKTPFENKQTKFNKGDIFLVGENTKYSFESQFKKLGAKGMAEFIPYSTFFKRYDHSEKGHFTKVVTRSGGVGDILALSTICNQLDGQIIFLTQRKYFDVFSYYPNKKIKPVDYTGAIFTNVNIARLLEMKKNFRLVHLDSAIEMGSSRNWYDVFYESTNIPENKDRRRPELEKKHFAMEDYLLVCHRSTANMRSASFRLFYEAILATIELDNYRPVCVHADNLTDTDKLYIDSLPDGSVKILYSKTLADFLATVYKAGMVVSVDSAAIHLREGVELPAIGVYNSFTSMCRSAGYDYTVCFDIKSTCELQPCFIHQNMPGRSEVVYHCPKDIDKTDFAPCFDRLTPDIHKQLTEGFSRAIKIIESGTKTRLLNRSKIELSNVTLVCVDCVNRGSALMAMKQSQKNIVFAKAMLFTDCDIEASGIEVVKIDRIKSKEEYSEFILKKLADYITTDYVLIVQYDGYVINPDLWNNNWLNYDYIGAPWWYDNNNVGNGGFSLRSKKLLEACKDSELSDLHPEDDRICRKYRTMLEEKNQIKFAPEEVAQRFSIEPNGKYPHFRNNTFGFHGIQQFVLK